MLLKLVIILPLIVSTIILWLNGLFNNNPLENNSSYYDS